MYVKIHISHTKSFNIPISIGLTTLAHALNGYEISCLNTTNYAISVCKISDIGYISPFWTVLVSWFPHSVLSISGFCRLNCVHEDQYCEGEPEKGQ